MTSLRDRWVLDPEVAFLNHGSFGACPRVVLDAAEAVRRRVEREPVRFLAFELEPLLDEARQAIATLLHADPADLVFVPNATAGANTVLRSIELRPGDELVTTDHAYNACSQAMEEVAARAGAKVVVAQIPLPISNEDLVGERVLGAVTPRTRLVLLDQVTSPTALVFPVKRLVAELSARGVDTLVDAAHAPGMQTMDLDGTGAAYTTGNFHKWLCAPRAAAFLHVRRDRHGVVRPLSISHGRNDRRTHRSRFHLEHDWTGTFDPAPDLAVPAAIRFLEGLLPGGLDAWRAKNHAAALDARSTLAAALEVELPCPDSMVGSMAALPLPEPLASMGPALSTRLFDEARIEVPIFPSPARQGAAAGKPLLRVSTPAYVTRDDIDRLVQALRAIR